MRGRELLDYYPNELKGEDEKHPKKKEKFLSGIKKEMIRHHTFQYLLRYAGKGQRDSIKRSHRVNQKNKIVETYIKRSKIEKELMNYKIHHFTQAC